MYKNIEDILIEQTRDVPDKYTVTGEAYMHLYGFYDLLCLNLQEHENIKEIEERIWRKLHVVEDYNPANCT